jgi:error-prone DNA polymerase
VGPTAAKAIVEARNCDRSFTSIAEFMERAGLHQQALENLGYAGAFVSIAEDRRAVKWEIGLRYRSVNSQLALPLPVNQDMLDLDPLSDWERMEGEYAVMGLHPASHVMAHLRKRLGKGVITSAELVGLEDGARVTVAGWVIRRQRPLGNAVYITLEDEYGHSPLVLWPKTYERLRHVFREPLVVVTGVVSRREGTMNVVVKRARMMPAISIAPKTKDWG